MKIVRKVRYVDIGLGVSEKERLTHDAALVRKRLHIARLNVSTFKQHSLSGFTLSPFHHQLSGFTMRGMAQNGT